MEVTASHRFWAIATVCDAMSHALNLQDEGAEKEQIRTAYYAMTDVHSILCERSRVAREEPESCKDK